MKKALKKKKKVSPIAKLLKKFRWDVLFLILVVIGSGLLLFQSNKQSPKTQTAETDSVYPSIEPVSTKNWKTYSNRLFGFTIQYPPNYTIGCHECHEQVDDDVEWSGSVFFKPQTPFSHEEIYLSFHPGYPESVRKQKESVEQYLKRQPRSSGSEKEVESLRKETKVGEFDALQRVFEFGPSVHKVTTQFFYKDTLMTISFSENLFAEEEFKTMDRPIYEFPEIATYHQMLRTFKAADLSKTRKITSLYKKSPDGTYYVRGKESGYGHQIILIDSKGKNVAIEVSSKEGPFGALRCYECGVVLGEWFNNYQFSVKLRGAFMDKNDKLIDSEYEYLINARTGKIELDTFKQVK